MNKLVYSFITFISIIILQLNALAQYQINGNASSTTPGCYQLTPDAAGQVGSVWNTSLIDLSNSFDMTFYVNLGCNDGGADGICFGLQPINTNIGVSGNGMGLGGVSPSLGIYIDTYQNSSPDNDPPEDHISLNSNGDVNHLTANNLAGPVPASSTSNDVEDCANHTLHIQWDAITQTLQVWFDGVLRLTYTGNIVANIFGGNPNVYWGFTGATGALTNAQSFCIITASNFSYTTSCVNSPLQFNDLSNSGTPILNWAWDFGDGSPIVSGSTAAFQNPVHTYTLSGNYTIQLTITNTGGGTSSISHIVTINPAPVITATGGTTICAGQTVNLTGTNSPNVNVPFTLSSSGANNNLAIFDNGVLGAWSGNGLGVFATSTIPVSGLNPGWTFGSVTINISHAWDSDLTIYLFNPCGNSIQLVNSNGGAGDNFTNTNFTSTATNPIGSGSAPFTGTFIPSGGAAAFAAFITASQGCAGANGNWFIRVGDHSGGISGTIVGWNISFYNSVASTYFWAPTTTMTNPNTLTPTVTPTITTTYTLTSQNAAGCISTAFTTVTVNNSITVTVNSPTICSGNAAILAANGAATYTWSTGLTPFGVDSATVSPLATTTYTVTGQSSLCTSTVTFTVTVTPALPVVSSPLTICNGSVAHLSVSGATNYVWSAGVTSTSADNSTGDASPTTTATYTVLATAGTCTAIATPTVTVVNIPVVAVSSAPVPLCTGHTATVTAIGATSYLWSDGSTANPLIVTPTVNTTYTVVGTNVICSNSATITLTLTANVLITVNSVTICSGDTATLVATGGNAYVWSSGTIPVSIDTVIVPAYSSNTYTVTGTTAGCSGTAVSTVTVIPSPIADFNFPAFTSIVNPKVQFLDNSTHSTTWRWNFGDYYSTTNNTSTLQNPLHNYADTGTYCVKQVAINTMCMDSTIKCITIEPEFTLYIPNAFTPNGNGDNNEFFAKGEYIQSMQMKIFDRWGNLVFNTDDKTKHWDGTKGGGVVQQDVYVYVINVTDTRNVDHKYIGSVTLVQ